MKRIIIILSMALLLVCCEYDRIVYGECQVKISNETAYSLDVRVDDTEYLAVAPGTSTEYQAVTYGHYGQTFYQAPILLAETGKPLHNRGGISVLGGESYTVRIYYDFYSGEYRYLSEKLFTGTAKAIE